MNEPFHEFLNLLADLIAKEVVRDRHDAGEEEMENQLLLSQSSAQKHSCISSERTGNADPIPIIPDKSHRKYRAVPKNLQPSIPKKKGEFR